MKKERLVNFRNNDEDIAVLEKAANKLSSETGEKPNVSKAIRHSAKQYAASEPELFFCNRIAIEETEKHIQYGRELLQNVINEFKVVTNYSLTLEQLKTVLKGINAMGSLVILKEAINEMAIRLIYEEQQKKYPDLNFSIDQIKIPDLSSILEKAAHNNFPWIQNHDIGIFWHVYEIADGKIVVNPVQLEKICEGYRIYATTSEEKTKLTEVKKLCRQLDGFIKNVSSPAVLNIAGLVYFDRFTGRFEPSEYYIKYTI